ncbi:hypothetical protein WICPIJ_010082 [Wickerhamomyces pijperi]|uniref:Uncharacterized protein n=1 Tax=Wickerhamomyces pijperi TaxID=599730 RepID=A0A9P8TBB6_WICPI|nr:hypothetical protein WICPIJ_010082 [Wickerhamomyces pijperi]
MEPKARALKASIGEANKVGIKIGKMTSDFMVMISSKADRALSESEDSNKFNKYGMISSTAVLPMTSWKESKALAAASRTDGEESTRVDLAMMVTKDGRISLTVRAVLATKDFQISIAALRTRTEVSERQTNNKDKTLSRRSSPRISISWALTLLENSDSSSNSALPEIPVIWNNNSPVSSTEDKRIRKLASKRPFSSSGNNKLTALVA